MTVYEQCPTCGRHAQDWTQGRDTSEAKSLQRDTEDRAAPYRSWRRTLRKDFYVTDLDQVEYRIVNEKVDPLAVLEITRIDGERPPNDNYLKAITDRYDRDAQGMTMVGLAALLGVPAYIVLFRDDMGVIWICDYGRTGAWTKASANTYAGWLAGLRDDR